MQMKKFWYLAYLLSFPLGMSPHRAMLNGCAMCDEHARESLAPCNEWGNATVKGSAERKKPSHSRAQLDTAPPQEERASESESCDVTPRLRMADKRG